MSSPSGGRISPRSCTGGVNTCSGTRRIQRHVTCTTPRGTDAMTGRILAWLRRHPVATVALAAATAIAVVLLVIWVLPALLTRRPTVDAAARQQAEGSARRDLVAMLLALGAAGGLAYTARTY